MANTGCKPGILHLCALAVISPFLPGCAVPPEAQTLASTAKTESPPRGSLSERIAYWADFYEVPETLVRRSIEIESGYNPNSRHGPFLGLMQIRPETAKSMGYHGPARGLLDADTNLKYAVAYLSNAYVVASGNPDRALSLYARGYFWEARRKGLTDQLKTASEE